MLNIPTTRIMKKKIIIAASAILGIAPWMASAFSDPQTLPGTSNQRHQYTNGHSHTVPLPALVTRSQDPWLWTSQSPLLTSEECQELIRWFRCNAEDSSPSAPTTTSSSTMDIPLLRKLQSDLDALFLRPSTDPVVHPRFLDYPAATTVELEETTHAEDDVEGMLNTLLPDGLHVDTNNGQWFRYLTVLVYLTNNPDGRGGSTIFPLLRCRDAGEPTSHLEPNAAAAAAQRLIQNGVQHTRVAGLAENDELLRAAKTMELQAAALDATSGCNDNAVLRVQPQQGHLCAFLNLHPTTGDPHPLTFHGPEGQNVAEKCVLSFFYEIPWQGVAHKADFATRVAERTRALQERYGENSTDHNDDDDDVMEKGRMNVRVRAGTVSNAPTPTGLGEQARVRR